MEKQRILWLIKNLPEIEGKTPRTMEPMARVPRQVYCNQGSMDVWHIDGNEQLFRWGLYVHHGVDGHSQYLLWSKVSLNKQAKTILRHYFDATQEFGVPNTLQSNRATERDSALSFCPASCWWMNTDRAFCPQHKSREDVTRN